MLERPVCQDSSRRRLRRALPVRDSVYYHVRGDRSFLRRPTQVKEFLKLARDLLFGNRSSPGRQVSGLISQNR